MVGDGEGGSKVVKDSIGVCVRCHMMALGRLGWVAWRTASRRLGPGFLVAYDGGLEGWWVETGGLRGCATGRGLRRGLSFVMEA